MIPIRPDILAAKLQAIRNLEELTLADQVAENPRLVELLWFIQAVSMRPGGLEKFVEESVGRYPERVNGQDPSDLVPPLDGSCASQECLELWKKERADLDTFGEPACEFGEWFDANLDENTTTDMLRGDFGYDSNQIQLGVRKFTVAYFADKRRSVQRALLPGYLRAMCEDRSVPFKGPWYFPELTEALLACMEAHAQDEAKALASTEVTRTILGELEFARAQRVPVLIIGDSRFGKTKTVATWCEMHPGRARLITVPDSNNMRDFLAAHADAFGFSYTDKTSAADLKRAVEFIYRHSGLFCVYDEAQFLIPTNYSAATAPRRLNWVRCQVIDRGLGCAFFATSQSYKQTFDSFAKKTGYRMEQWLGRIAPPVVLPSELGWDELLAVARVHFPDLDPDYGELIASRAMQSEGYLKSFEQTAKYALHLAQQAGRPSPTLEDIQQAIGRMMPARTDLREASASAAQGRRRSASAAALPPAFLGTAKSFQTAAAKSDLPGRKPAGVADSAIEDDERLSPVSA
jgi:hypothetical protein